MTTDLKTNPFESDAFVYIRHLDAGELSGILPANAIDQIDEPDDLFVVASADGVRLAVVQGREVREGSRGRKEHRGNCPVA